MTAESSSPSLGRLAPSGRYRWLSAGVAGALAVVSAVVLATASWSSLDTPLRDSDLPDGAVMSVDGTVVTEAELEARVESLRALYGVQPPTEPDKLDTFRRDAAKSLAVSMVIETAAADRGIAVADKQAQAQLATIISEQLGGDRQAFTAYLAEVGVTERQVLDEIARTLVNQRLFEEVTSDVPAATAAQAQAEYDDRRAEMREPEERRLSNIVVKTEAAALRVRRLLEAGRPFPLVANRLSQDTATKNTGGDLGLLTLERLDPAYGQAAFAAAAGEVFGPVESEFGWNVGKVVAVVRGRPLSFADLEQTLLQALTTKAQLDVWRAFMRDALAQADIEYADDYLPDDPDALPSDVLQQREETTP